MYKDINTQAQNKVTVIGKLMDVAMGDGTLSDGRKYNRATLTVRVTQTFGGRTETSEIPVSMFAAQYTKTNKPNPGYDQIRSLTGFKTAQNVGIDEADVVRISGANLQENNYVTKSGQLVNNWQISTSFINQTKMSDAATFSIDVFIMDMRDELDREEEPTGRLILKGGIVQYGGRLDVIEFIVEQPETVEYIRRNWEPNTTVTVKGRFRVTSVEETSKSSSSWGEDIPEASTRFVRELIITKGDDEPKDEEYSYDPMEIKKAFNVRKANIEQMRMDATQKAASTTKSSSDKYGWE